MKCIICENESFSLSNQFESYAVMECQNCYYAIVDPIPDAETLERLYNSNEYFDTHMQYDFNSITDGDIEKKVQEQVSFHSSMLKGIKINPRKRMLEVGPGGGFALKAFSLMGYKVTGLETSKIASSFIKNKMGLPVVNA